MSCWLLIALLAPDAGLPAAAASAAAPASGAPASAATASAAAASAAPASAAPAPMGPPPTVQMACAPDPLLVGQILQCTLTILHRSDVSITVTAPPNFDTAPPGAAQPEGAGLKSVRVLSTQALDPKPVKVDGLRIIWREATGGEGALAVPKQEVKVRSLLTGVTDPAFRTYAAPQTDAKVFFDAHGPLPYRITNWPLIIALISLAGILVSAGLTILVKRFLDARRVDPGPPVDPRPAHVIALAALDALTAEPELDVKTYYSRLSEIIRAYLEKRYGFMALEMTSHEIRNQVIVMGLTGDARAAIDRFADETDLVKFAAYRPKSGEADTMMLAARGLIQITRQADEVGG